MGDRVKDQVIANWEQKVLDKFGNSFELISVSGTKESGERTITVKCLTCGTISKPSKSGLGFASVEQFWHITVLYAKIAKQNIRANTSRSIHTRSAKSYGTKQRKREWQDSKVSSLIRMLLLKRYMRSITESVIYVASLAIGMTVNGKVEHLE